LPSQDDVARLSIYLGIPAQEFRTIQSNLAKLVGGLLRLAYIRRQRKPNDVQFQSLLEGASTYSSVYGYWASEGVRMDDHSEVVEFLVSREHTAPIEILVITEVVFPALFLARQKEILLLIEHGHRGATRLRVAQVLDPDLFNPRDKLETRMSGPTVDPLEWLETLLRMLRRPADGPPIELEGAANHLDALAEAFRIWKQEHYGKPLSSQPGQDRLLPEPDLTAIELPTVYIRLLLSACSWWIFNGASRLLRDCYSAASDRLTRNPLWNADVMGGLISELTRFLNELRSHWIEQYIFNPGRGGKESADPVVNAMLWLAFVHDYLIFCQQSMEVAEAAEPSQPSAAGVAGYFFDTLATTLLGPDLAFRKKTRDQIAYWSERLDILSGVNDRDFPDAHFVQAWRMLFRFLSKPQINFLHEPSPELLHGSRPKLVSWEPKTGAGAQVDWWNETYRMWSDFASSARMWLSPLVLDAVSRAGLSKGPRGAAGSRFKMKERVLKTLAKEAIAGFPVKAERAWLAALQREP
jgi:hypothetical protein